MRGTHILNMKMLHPEKKKRKCRRSNKEQERDKTIKEVRIKQRLLLKISLQVYVFLKPNHQPRPVLGVVSACNINAEKRVTVKHRQKARDKTPGLLGG
jgi:hypothetical protein